MNGNETHTGETTMDLNKYAADLKDHAELAGYELSEAEALVLAKAAKQVAEELEEARKEAAIQARRRADVAAHCAELREFGLWDGE